MLDAIVDIEYALIALAPALLAWEWWRGVARRRWSASLIVTSVSCLWLVLALVWRGAAGPDYSNAHAYIFSGNALAAIVVAVVSAVIRSQRSTRVIVAAIALAVIWLTGLAVMYAV